MRILVVDDELPLCEVFGEFLRGRRIRHGARKQIVPLLWVGKRAAARVEKWRKA